MQVVLTPTNVSLPCPTGALGDFLMKKLGYRLREDVRAEARVKEEHAAQIREQVAAPIVVDTRDVVTVTLPETRVTDRYLKTFDRLGVARWFEIARIVSWQQLESGRIQATMPRTALTARKMDYLLEG